jgi:hypothetical protein
MFTFRLRRGTSVEWAEVNPILQAGEQGYETDTKLYKIGDGENHWNDLDGYVPNDEMMVMINVAVQEAIGLLGVSGLAEEILTDHINSPAPHPVYDDAPSLTLLYENART